MSLTPPGTAPLSDINLYTFFQVAITSAALYDHALSLGREVVLIWMKPLTPVTVLYVIERYLGDTVLIWLMLMLFGVNIGRGKSKLNMSRLMACTIFFFIRCIRLFQFRAWGALTYSWATQATMLLRLYAMYRQSRQVLIISTSLFFCEIAAIAFIIWRTIGPSSALKAMSNVVSGQQLCTFSGINPDFIYIFIPFLFFELFLFLMAALVFVDNVKRNKKAGEEKGLRVNPFMSFLARDSLRYFFMNLVACAVVMGLWQTITELYANICIPFVMFLEVLVGTRLILDFRERYARTEPDQVFSGGYSSLHFRGEEARLESAGVSILCQIETIVVADNGL